MQVSRWELKGSRVHSRVQTQNSGFIVWTLDVAVVKRLRAYTSLIAMVSYFLSFLKCRVIMWTRRGADMLQWHTFAHYIAHTRHIHCTYKAHTLHHVVPPCSHGLCMCDGLHPLRIPLQSGPLSWNKTQNGPKRKQNPQPILPSNRVSFCLETPELQSWCSQARPWSSGISYPSPHPFLLVPTLTSWILEMRLPGKLLLAWKFMNEINKKFPLFWGCKSPGLFSKHLVSEDSPGYVLSNLWKILTTPERCKSRGDTFICSCPTFPLDKSHCSWLLPGLHIESGHSLVGDHLKFTGS